SDSYSSTQFTQYHTDAQRAINALLLFEPYHSRASQFQFHIIDNLTDLKCVISSGLENSGRYMACDRNLVIQAVNNARIPYDSIAVIQNNAIPAGGGNIDMATVTNDIGDPNDFFPIMFVHEFGGHSFGYLLDNYSYGTTGTIDN